MNDLQSLARIAVIDDDSAAGLVSESARTDLVARVTAVPAIDVTRPGRRRQRRWLHARRKWMVSVPLVAALSAGALAIGLFARTGGPGTGIAKAALVITKHGRGVDVIVHNPRAVSADVKHFRKELKAEGANVTIVLMPVSPPMVGKYLGYGANKELGQLPGLSGIGKNGIRVSAGFQGPAEIFIGRAAQPGEFYWIAESATAPGEVLAGLDIAGKTVAEVLPMLDKAGAAPVYNLETVNSDGQVVDTQADNVPGDYFVYGAWTYQPGKVQIDVGSTPTPPVAQPDPSGTPAPSGTPEPTDSATPSNTPTPSSR
jgi:hypothetical protein